MKALFDLIESRRGEIIELVRQLVQIPSATYEEGALAVHLANQLKAMGADTCINVLGDVTGIFPCGADLPLLVLNTHLDQAEAGDMEDAFSGKLMDGAEFGVPGEVIYGRGTNGQKACLAAMLAAAQAVLDLNLPLKRGFAINAGVLEECGGHLSPQILIEQDRLPIYAVICGEHTNLQPVNGQRGMLHVHLRIEGKGGHAAAPQGSSSAVVGLARVILGLAELCARLPKDPVYGDALVSLNKVSVNPNVINAIPDLCEGVIDIRHPVTVPREQIVARVQEKVGEVLAAQPGLRHTAEVRLKTVHSYTGLEGRSDGGMLPFYTPPDAPLLAALQDSLEEVTGARPAPVLWSISSEAGYFSSKANLPVVCFGPGEDRFTHNRYEHVRVEDVLITTKVYAAMVLKLCS